jgi:hypothetical protein
MKERSWAALRLALGVAQMAAATGAWFNSFEAV